LVCKRAVNKQNCLPPEFAKIFRGCDITQGVIALSPLLLPYTRADARCVNHGIAQRLKVLRLACKHLGGERQQRRVGRARNRSGMTGGVRRRCWFCVLRLFGHATSPAQSLLRPKNGKARRLPWRTGKAPSCARASTIPYTQRSIASGSSKPDSKVSANSG